MLSLIFGVLLVVLIVWLVTGMTRSRKNPLDDIAKLAAIEATAPQSSVARKLLTEELERPAREAKKRQGLWIVIVAFFAVTYIFVPASDTSKQTSAPVEHAASQAHGTSMICGTAGDCGNSDTAKPVAPVVPQKHPFTVIKSLPACATADDVVQLIEHTATAITHQHCEHWLEIGKKVWIEDEAERTIDGSRTLTIEGSPTIKLICVTIGALYIIHSDSSPPYRPTCYWTGLGAVE